MNYYIQNIDLLIVVQQKDEKQLNSAEQRIIIVYFPNDRSQIEQRFI